ncbi:biotin transporter BioY [Gracilibacillus sp. HCP3S3_G5_1]|uniref:biotin transporter BioY n=1 Tax=unclassified Gracilibacillus TaxID=2625209 RepID=UPI003F8ADE64
MHSNKLRGLILASIFAAITGILAQLQVQLWVVPFSGQTLAVGLTATIIGSRLGALSMIAYLLIGMIGLPVFAGLMGGPQVLVGPTGGYIFGFIATAYVTGLILEKTTFNFKMALIANIVGMFITLAFGMTQLKFVADLSWSAAIASGVIPFLVVGIIKAILASWLGIIIRRRLMKANLL